MMKEVKSKILQVWGDFVKWLPVEKQQATLDFFEASFNYGVTALFLAIPSSIVMSYFFLINTHRFFFIFLFFLFLLPTYEHYFRWHIEELRK